MQDKLISLETAKLAKEKGFDILIENYFRTTGSGPFKSDTKKYNWNDDHKMETAGNMTYISAPTQSLLQRWLRESKGLHICIDVSSRTVNKYIVKIHYLKTHFPNKGVVTEFLKEGSSAKEFNTYEDALEKALFEALKLI